MIQEYINIFIGNPSLLPVRLFMLYLFLYSFSERVRVITVLVIRFILKTSEKLILALSRLLYYPFLIVLWVSMKIIFPLVLVYGVGLMIFFLLPILVIICGGAIFSLARLFIFGVI